MIAPAPVIEQGGELQLDKKFVEGMHLHCEMWSGSVACILRRGSRHIPFGASYRPHDLEFSLKIIDKDEIIEERHLEGYSIVFCAADDHSTLHVASLCRNLGIKIVYTIEYTLQTRRQIAIMDSTRSAVRRVYSIFWNIRQEMRRRNAFRLADGVQMNGYPAAAAYDRFNANTIMYLDNRMKPDMFATAAEMEARGERLRSGAPLRLIHSGRLERMKGAQDLVPIATALRDRGVNFTLDIYGDGSLRNEIRDDASSRNLNQVRLHEPVDFETELVPLNRSEADIFLSCHRQSDPSCTYIESMGCGLPVAGYDNEMWSALLQDSGGGWAVPMKNVDLLADKIAYLSEHRDEIVQRGEAGLAFARRRDFYTEFSLRMDHLHAVERNLEFRSGNISRD